MTTQAALWWAAAGAVVLAVLAGAADWLRTRRRDLNRVGWMPWTLVQIVALFAALIFVVLAIRS